MKRADDLAAAESAKEKADRYFADQCLRLGPITSGSMIVGHAPPRLTTRLDAVATETPASRARARKPA